MEGLEPAEGEKCAIHHTALVKGQCAVCNRDEDREEVAETSSRGWRDADARVLQREDPPAGGKDESAPRRTFRDIFSEGVREQLGDSPVADKILERQKPSPAREAEPQHRPAHVKKKKLR